MDDIEERDELAIFLGEPIEDVSDPIAWWWDHRHAFPRLSLMAFDYLSIPGMIIVCHDEF